MSVYCLGMRCTAGLVSQLIVFLASSSTQVPESWIFIPAIASSLSLPWSSFFDAEAPIDIILLIIVSRRQNAPLNALNFLV